ncbi:MAG: hypothetical protein AB7T20_08885 [Steroidobacteraceae bacterium]
MTLLIACILIYNFDMPAGWYLAALAIWAIKLWAYDRIVKANVKAASCRYPAN